MRTILRRIRLYILFRVFLKTVIACLVRFSKHGNPHAYSITPSTFIAETILFFFCSREKRDFAVTFYGII